MVDGLPPAYSFGPRRDFSISFLRFISNGTIVLALNFFGTFDIYIYIYIYIKGFIKYGSLEKSQCRERAAKSFEMTKNISREKMKFGRKIFFIMNCIIVLGPS